MANLLHRALTAAMASSGKLAAQVLISVAATVCAAVVVPQLLPRFGLAMVPARVAVPLAAPTADLDAAFVRPAAPPLEDMGKVASEPVRAATLPVNIAAEAPAGGQTATPPRGCGQRCEVRRAGTQAPAAPMPPPRPAAPLELAAMMTPQPPVAEAPRHRLFGLQLPQLPFEDKVVQSVTSARNAVSRLFE
ncbi:MAG: hypothetical protein J0H01_22075 [Rhizobiales bacterium]|nr:hypothetical protein [Hyphomicrobiales bacterium]